MNELTVTDRIWNRACEGGGESPLIGDQALAALLLFHGAAMNGGVIDAVECLSPEQLTAALDGYRHYDLESIAELIGEAKKAILKEQDLDNLETVLDQQYHALIADDGVLFKIFENHHKHNPHEYSLLL